MGCAGMQESGKLRLSTDRQHEPAAQIVTRMRSQTAAPDECNQAFLSDNETACFVIQISTGSH